MEILSPNDEQDLSDCKDKTDGAPLELPDGTKYWYNSKGELHREDGPAFIIGEDKYWYLNGEIHREDGPAVTFPSGWESWYLRGEHLLEKEHKRVTTCPIDELPLLLGMGYDKYIGERLRKN